MHSKCCTRLDKIFISSLSHHWQMPKSSAQSRSKWVFWEAAPECCPGRNWQCRMLSARAVGFVISSFHGLLLWKSQCLLQDCENLAPTCYYSCAQEFPRSAAGHMEIHIPLAQHVMKEALSCFSSAHTPVSSSGCRALSTTLGCQLIPKIKPSHSLGSGCPSSGWAFLISATSLLRHGNRIPQNNQHVGTSRITHHHQADISCPPS